MKICLKRNYVLFVILILPVLLNATVYYVKPTGTNTAAGTSWATAWQTIQYAADSMTNGDITYVSNGVYIEQVDITNKNSISLIGYGNEVRITGVWATNYALKIFDSQNVKIGNFELCSNIKSMIFLSNSDNCVISNNKVYENSYNYDLGAGIQLIDSDNNKIIDNEIFNIESLSNTKNCYGVYLYHSHNNLIISNEIRDSGSGALYGGIDIWFHGIYLLNSDNNYIRYNTLHDMDHYGIHILADNSKGAPYTFLDNKILDNTLYGLDRAISTHEVQNSISDSLTGQVVGRNKIYNTAKGIEWDANTTGTAGAGGWCFKNSIANAWSNNNYLEGVIFIDWPKINFSYNSIRGYYNGIVFQNYDYIMNNNVMSTNYNLNIVQSSGGASQSIQYSCTQAGKVGFGVSAGAGNIAGSALFFNKYITRLQYDSPCIGIATPGVDGVRGSMGAHTSYLHATNENAGMITAYTLVFVTSPYDGAIPNDGKIKVTFPFSFVFSSPAVVGHNMGGSLTVSSSGNDLIFTRSGGTAFPTNRPMRIIFSGIQNPDYDYNDHYCIITTMSNNGKVIEREESNHFRTVNAVHILTVTTNQPVSATNVGLEDAIIMSLHIQDTGIHTLESIKIGNAGTMLAGTDIKSMKLWYDSNTNYIWDNDDIYITDLIWNGTSYWSNYNINVNIGYPGQNFVVTVDFETTVSESRYFKAYIPINGIKCSGNTNAPQSALTNYGETWYIRNFQFPPDTFFRFRASCMVLGDTDNDGWLDFLVAGNLAWGSSDKHVYHYINNKDGTFTGVNIQNNGIDFGAIVLGDIDNDGDLDVIYSGERGNSAAGVSLRRRMNDGSGNFGSAIGIGTYLSYSSFALADIDGDGDLDLIASGADRISGSWVGRLETYFNNGDGSFSSAVSFGVPVYNGGIGMGDWDNDGDFDLIVTGSGRLDIYYNKGDGTFTGPYSQGYGNSASSVAVGDINNDGWQDILVTGSSGANDVTRLINNKDGTFSTSVFGREHSTGALLLGDLDNDGDLDLIGLGHGGVYVYYNNGSGAFSGALYLGNYAGGDYRSSGVLGDIDNDGDLDLIVAGRTHPGVGYIFYNVHNRVNTEPNQPINLSEENVDYKYRFKWTPNSSQDDHTSDTMLRYKIAIGTNQSGTYEYSSTNIDYPAGKANIGNVAAVTACYYQSDIPTYHRVYWKICAIDTSFKFSDYSPERIVIPTGGGPYYVATNGSDFNNGSFTNPFRTIQRAVDVMSSGQPECNYPFTYVLPGVYKEQVTFRSNKNQLYMVITALSNNKKTVITGVSNSAAFFITNTSRIRISGFDINSYSNYGISITGIGSNIKIYRNLIRDNPTNIYVSGSYKSVDLYNNTIFNSTSGDGVVWKGSSYGKMANNILLSNQGYGIKCETAGDVFLSYNDFYGNISGPTNGGLIWGNHNFTNDPMLETVSSFTIVSRYSYALDSATNMPGISDVYTGPGPDMGWKESFLSNIHHGPFYVDVTNGLDQYPGTRDRPFKTIQKAVDRISFGVEITSATCYVLPGVYNENVAISANNNTNYMVFRAYSSNAPPVLDGTGLLGNDGIWISYADRVIINNFKITSYPRYGIYMTSGSLSNIIINNEIFSNDSHGICINSGTGNYNIIKGNRLHNNGYEGITIQDGDWNMIIRNVIYQNNRYGVYLLGSANYNEVINNTIVNNNEHGIRNNGLSYIYNNIILSNQQYGIYQGGSTARAGYNILYGNAAGPWDDVAMDPVNFIGVNPIIDTLTSFTILSKQSPAVDNGTVISNVSDVYNGVAPDIGWKESTFSTNRKYVHILPPTDIWTNTINNALNVASNNSIIECYVPPWHYNEQINIAGYTNLIIRAFNWMNSQDNYSTVLIGKGCEHLITITNSKNISIIGFTISNSSYDAVYMADTISNRIMNNRFISNRRTSIYINSEKGDYNYIASNEICYSKGSGANYGVWIVNGDHNTVYSNRIHHIQDYSILIQADSTSNDIINNIFYSNNNYAVYIDNDSADFNSIISNKFIHNYSGIDIINADYASIRQNTFIGVKDSIQYYGILIQDGMHHLIYSNEIKNQRSHGIYLYGAARSNRIIKNSISSNGVYGIYFYGDSADNNQILSNRICFNDDYGIYLNYADQSIIRRNLIYNNQYGIVGGNAATGNRVINNTISFHAYDGLNCGANTVFTDYNNIYMSNNRYGVYSASSAKVYCGYDLFYNNLNKDWTADVIILANCSSGIDPLIEITNDFIITSSNSPCVDSGTNYYNEWYAGSDIDIGWKESNFTNAPQNWVHIIPMDVWTRSISTALNIATNGSIIECYSKPGGFTEQVFISGFTNLIIRSFDWTNSRNNSSTVIKGDLFYRSIVITNSEKITIEGFTITNAYNYGIYIINASFNNILNNRIIDNGGSIGSGAGIYIENEISDYNFIASNEIYNSFNNNQDYGVIVKDADHNTVYSNRIHHIQDYGVYFTGTAQSNFIVKNVIWSNRDQSGSSGIYINSETADYNSILTNTVFDHKNVGVYIINGDYNMIVGNDVYGFQDQNWGIYISGGNGHIISANLVYKNDYDGINLNSNSQSNIITGNVSYSNGYNATGNYRNGIHFYSEGEDYNSIRSNTLYGNRYHGVFINSGDYNSVTRNLVYNNVSVGIYLYNGADDTKIINNTVFGNGHSGVYSYNSITTNIFNNIFLSNARYGVEKIGGTVKVGYNVIYGNGMGVWTSDVTILENNIINAEPLIDTISPFTIISSNSPCVDSGTNYYNEWYAGTGIDIGWKESSFSNAPRNWVHIIPMDIWTRSIYESLQIATNNSILECYPNPLGFTESIFISGFTNLRIFAFAWTNSRDNSTTIIDGTAYNISVIITNSKNITVEGFTISNASQHGIHIINAFSNNILNNRIIDNGGSIGSGAGIYLEKEISDYNFIATNEIYNSSGAEQDYGIYITDSDHNSVISNMIYDNDDYGIYITGTSTSNTLVLNEIANKRGSAQNTGIYIYSDTADYNSISSNKIYNNISYGVYIRESDNNHIQFNKVYNQGNRYQDIGLYFHNSDNNLIFSNTIYRHWSGSDDYGIYLYRNADTTMSNYIIKNTIYSNYYGIYLLNNQTRDNFILTNRVYSNYRGMLLNASRDTRVYRNLFFNNQDIGIYIYNTSGFNDVINNTFFNNYRGLYLTSSQVNITNNVFQNHTGYGIYISTGTADSCPYDYNVFWDNANDTNNHSAFVTGSSNHYGPPMLNTAGDFEIISSFSYCVDRGKQIQGVSMPFQALGPDIGWKESSFTATNRPEVVHILPPMDIWTNSITNALKVATNNSIIECHSEAGSFNESVLISGFTNLILRAYDWINSQDNTTTVIDALSYRNGILIKNSKNIKIQGFSIMNAVNGICVSNAVSNRILHNRIYDNTENGILLADSGTAATAIVSNKIFNLTGSDQNYGVRIRDSSYHSLYSNTLYNLNDYAVYLTGESRYNSIINNQIGNIGETVQNQAVFIDNGDYNIISFNHIFKNFYDGIYIINTAVSNYIMNNVICSNSRHGIQLYGNAVDYNSILTNEIYGNINDGIYVYNGDYNKIYRNRIYNNQRYGVYNNYYANNAIINNVIYYNSDYGIRGYNNSDFDVDNNIILSNGSYGISGSGSAVIRASYNLFYGNTIAPWNSGVTIQAGNILGLDPLIDTVTSFTIISVVSPAVDNGTNYYSEVFQGNGIDIGWRESSFTAPDTNYVYILPPVDRWTNTINNALAIATNNSVIRCFVKPGGFAESVFISGFTNLTIQAYEWITNKDNSATVINGGGFQRVVIITNSSRVRIEGFSIEYANGEGVFISGSKDTDITHNRINYNNIGIHITNSISNYLSYNEIYNNNYTGIRISAAYHNTLYSNYIDSNKINGVVLTSGAGTNNILHNSIFNNGVDAADGSGIRIETADYNSISGNKIFDTALAEQDYGVYILSGDCNAIQSNEIHHNQDNGIYIYNGVVVSNSIKANVIYSNVLYGIYIYSDTADYTLISHNQISGLNQDIGIYLRDADRNTLFSNEIYRHAYDGIYFYGTARSNNIIKNRIYDNSRYGIRLDDVAQQNNILTNIICSNVSVGVYILPNPMYNLVQMNELFGPHQDYGVINYGDKNRVCLNRIYNHDYDGVQLVNSAQNNYISKNEIFSNGISLNRYGIYLNGNHNNHNQMISNKIYNNYYGIFISQGDNNKIIRNLITDNTSCGIYQPAGADNNSIINNTLIRNGYSGLYSVNSVTTNIFNNIFFSNIRYGVEMIGGTVRADYNCFFSNTLGPWNAGVSALGNNITKQNPLIDTITSFTIISANSPCVDTGLVISGISSNYNGFGPDMGWKESDFSNSTSTNTYVHIIPADIWTRTIAQAILIATNNSIIECYVKSNGYEEPVYISGFTNLILRAYDWTNSHDNTTTFIWGDSVDFFDEIIFIINSKNVMVQGFTISNACYNGILIKNAVSNKIYNNRILNNASSGAGAGIRLDTEFADYNVIAGNEIFDQAPLTQDYGIRISSGDHNTIFSNIIHNNQTYGIYLTSTAQSNWILQNTVYSNASVGVYLYSDTADYNQIINNEVYGPGQNCGVCFYDADNNKIVSNSVYRHTSYYGIYLENGTSTRDNYISHNQVYSNNEGVYIYTGSGISNSIMSNNIYENYDCGIYLRSPHYTSVIGNNIYNYDSSWQQNNGIYLTDGDYNLIRSNYVYHHKDYGIYVGASAQYNRIVNNYVRSTRDLYTIRIESDSADNNVICSNRITDSRYDGILISSSDYNDVFRNIVYSNQQYGIYNYNGAYQNNIHNNTIVENGDTGIENYRSSAWVFNNIIMSNNNYGVNINDNGSSSYWLEVKYNMIYGNQTACWDVNDTRLLIGGYNITNLDPMIQAQYPYAIISPFSRAVDTATNIPGVSDSWQGTGPDRGWLESSYTNVEYYGGPFYVDNISGNDLNNGSFAYPFSTISRAVSRIGSGVNITAATCYIFPGAYNESVLVASNHYNGDMVITGLSNQSPVLTGGLTNNYAFQIENASNVIIRGLTIRSYNNGIVINDYSTNVMIKNNIIYSNENSGLLLNSDRVSHNYIISNRFSGENQDSGIYINYSDYNIIRGNNIHQNGGQGITFYNSARYNYIVNNNIVSNLSYGLCLNHPLVRYNYIYTNYISGPEQSIGISINAADYTTVESNQIRYHDNIGLYFQSDSSGNRIINNNIYDNATNGIYIDSNTADNNFIFFNLIRGALQDFGIRVNQGDNQIMSGNTVFSNNNTGLYIEGSANTMVSNNIFYNNREGIKQINSSLNVFLNSIIKNTNGFRLNSGTLIEFRKNNIYSNSRYNFITLQPNQIITNNWWGSTVASVIASGISNNGSYSNFTPYRLLGPFNITAGADTAPISIIHGFNVSLSNDYVKLIWEQSQDLDFTRYRIYRSDIPGTTNLDSSYVITNITVSSITQFKDNPGNGTWYYTITAFDNPASIVVPVNQYTNECWYADVLNVAIGGTTKIVLSKSISNIQLNGIDVESIPGATITFIIIYSNIGSVNGEQVVIYDRLSPYVIYHTNAIGTATGWTLEYSTNQIPIQAYNSTDYTNGYAVKSNIKWIRWRKDSVAINEDGKSLIYKVIIK